MIRFNFNGAEICISSYDGAGRIVVSARAIPDVFGVRNPAIALEAINTILENSDPCGIQGCNGIFSFITDKK